MAPPPGNRMSTQPIAARLKYLGGLEEISPAVLRSAQMPYDTVVDDAAAAAGAGSTFGPVGAGHSSGLVPDPGIGTSPQIDEILFNDADWKHGRSVRRVAQYDSNNVLVPGSNYGGRVYDLQDEGIVADYLLNGSINGSFTDNAALFQSILNSLEQFDTIIAPPGYWALGSDVIFPSGLNGIRFEARGGYSNVVRTYNGGTNSGTATPGILLPINGNLLCKNIWFWASAVNTGGIAIGRALGSTSDSLEQNILDNIFFTSFGGSFFGCLQFDGTEGFHAYGARRNKVNNGIFHGGPTGFGIRLGGNQGSFGVTDCDFVGATSIANIWMLGASYNINDQGLITGRNLGSISIDWTTVTTIVGAVTGDVSITGNCTAISITLAFLGGTFTDNGVNTTIFTPTWPRLQDAASDAAAAGLGVELAELYRDGNTVKVRIA